MENVKYYYRKCTKFLYMIFFEVPILSQILTLIVVYAIANFFLYFGQDLWYAKEMKACDSVEKKMDIIVKDAKSIAYSIKYFHNQLDTIDNIMKLNVYQIDSINNLLNNSDITLDNKLITYQDYKIIINQHDSLAKVFNYYLPIFDSLKLNLNKKINQFDTLYNKYDSMHTKAYSRIWIIPVPKGYRNPQNNFNKNTFRNPRLR